MAGGPHSSPLPLQGRRRVRSLLPTYRKLGAARGPATGWRLRCCVLRPPTTRAAGSGPQGPPPLVWRACLHVWSPAAPLQGTGIGGAAADDRGGHRERRRARIVGWGQSGRAVPQTGTKHSPAVLVEAARVAEAWARRAGPAGSRRCPERGCQPLPRATATAVPATAAAIARQACSRGAANLLSPFASRFGEQAGDGLPRLTECGREAATPREKQTFCPPHQRR